MSERLSTKPTDTLTRGLDADLPIEALASADAMRIAALPSFLTLLQNLEGRLDRPYAAFPCDWQDAVVFRRLRQLVEICRSNRIWRERIDSAIGHGPLMDYGAFRALPFVSKAEFAAMFTGSRDGLVVPLEAGGFQIASSGGTSSGAPSEIVYSRQELWDTYHWAGAFIGRHLLKRHIPEGSRPWIGTTLSDRDLWSSGTMVGGVLQQIPDANYLGIGTMSGGTFRRIMAYPGHKCLMGTSGEIAALVDLANDLDERQRASLRIALYGSGAMYGGVQRDLRAAYPNLITLSFFAATQAETIGLQLSSGNEVLTAVPGLHFIEVVKDDGEWALPGEEGDLVITRLFGNHAPILRLKLGDRVVRLPDATDPALNSLNFSYVGRSDDLITFGKRQYYAPSVLRHLTEALRDYDVVDLSKLAYQFQFQQGSTLDLCIELHHSHQLRAKLSSHEVRHRINQCVERAVKLSVGLDGFNARWKTGKDHIHLVPVDVGSPRIVRTPLGKTPLITSRLY